MLSASENSAVPCSSPRLPLSASAKLRLRSDAPLFSLLTPVERAAELVLSLCMPAYRVFVPLISSFAALSSSLICPSGSIEESLSVSISWKKSLVTTVIRSSGVNSSASPVISTVLPNPSSDSERPRLSATPGAAIPTMNDFSPSSITLPLLTVIFSKQSFSMIMPVSTTNGTFTSLPFTLTVSLFS